MNKKKYYQFDKNFFEKKCFYIFIRPFKRKKCFVKQYLINTFLKDSYN